MSHREQDTRQEAPDVEMTDAESSDVKNVTGNQIRSKKPTKHTTISQFTIRNPTWAYLHLHAVLTSSSNSSSLDALTVQLQLQSALSSFLGLHGTAIPLDFLKIEDRDVWLRVPRDDGSAVVAAVGGWVGRNGEGWRVKNWGCWGPDLSSRSGVDLFDT